MSVKLSPREKKKKKQKTPRGKDKSKTNRSGRTRSKTTRKTHGDKKKPSSRKSPTQIQRSNSWRKNLAIWLDDIG